MWHRLATVRASVWLLVALTGALGVFSLIAMRYLPAVQASTLTYIATPIAGAVIAVLAFALSTGLTDRVQHKGDKAVLVGSVLAIWFVGYFATGIFVTFMRNALVSNPQAIAVNIAAFGVAAAALEYARHRTMLLAGRRNALWVGVLVACVFALAQINISHIAAARSFVDVIKLFVSDIAPAITSSALLTYLAVACGLPAQLTYRLGTLAITILPPIIPKYDWYLSGVSSILLTVIVYLVIDRSQRSRHEQHRRHHTKRAYDGMWTIAMIGLALFMTGAFAYKPSAIMSDSMDPTFTRGSVVIIKKDTNPMDINVGDIIQYGARGLIITHRVITIDHTPDGSGKRIFITKGDNNPSQDPPVAQNQVLGIVRAQIPYIGYPTVWLHEMTVGNASKQVNG